jgi:starch synthase (maltosyl-transferring)
VVLYNIFPSLLGPFARWEPHLKRAAEMGFDWVFLNPIQQLGASDSLYSIADYFRINPAFLAPESSASPEEQFLQVVDQARTASLKLMIDLVLNHCAIDSPLTKEHPEWFVHEPDGRITNAFCVHNQQKVVWKDLAQFEHEHTSDPEGFYRYCLRIIEHLVSLGFDGFRCDAAYKIPAGFWQRLINDARTSHPGLLFAAETLGCPPELAKETARAGFNYVFNSSRYWNFKDPWLIAQYNLLREITPSISFPESHDTARLFAQCKGNINAMKQRYLFAALFSAGVMIPLGFEFGFSKPLHVVKTTPADWENTSTDLRAFITKVNEIKKTYTIFNEESPTHVLHSPNPNVLMMLKECSKPPHQALLLLNKDPWHHQDFATDSFRHFIKSEAPLRDVSPEYPLDHIHQPFHYSLRAGQGIVLVTDKR